jgi:hypothetical protein
MESHEDEAFNEIERKAKQRMEAVRAAMLREEDDDIQDYKKPWVGLTDEEIWTVLQFRGYNKDTIEIAKAIEAKLKEKNT